ncbi:MAG: hypothetical protein M3R48_00500 [Candidatus Dormibacteraeota bacterium]|nr:hypothetical protein [Candidatus Dormibacteraeota bacterium]
MKGRVAAIAAVVCTLLTFATPVAAVGASAATGTARDFRLSPTSTGVPGDAAGKCQFTSGREFYPGAVWTCHVEVISLSATKSIQWKAVGGQCNNNGKQPWMCESSFSPDAGTLGPLQRVRVTIKTAIGACANYNLYFETAATTVPLHIRCG